MGFEFWFVVITPRQTIITLLLIAIATSSAVLIATEQQLWDSKEYEWLNEKYPCWYLTLKTATYLFACKAVSNVLSIRANPGQIKYLMGSLPCRNLLHYFTTVVSETFQWPEIE